MLTPHPLLPLLLSLSSHPLINNTTPLVLTSHPLLPLLLLAVTVFSFSDSGKGGNHVEVFTAQGGSPGAGWKKHGDYKKEFQKVVRTFAFVLGGSKVPGGGGNQRNSYVQFPEKDASRVRTAKSLVGLKQPFLLFQLLVPAEAGFAIELDVTDTVGVRRRLDFSTVAKRKSHIGCLI